MFNDVEFKSKHKQSCNAFTRERKLGFKLLMILILQKSVKSVQNRINEFFDKLCSGIAPATASAFTQARSNLSHSAFIALNQEGIINSFYEDGAYKKWRGYRLLAVDGSKLVLPPSNEIREEFGSLETTDNKGNVQGEYNAALASVLYDVLNGVAIDSIVAHCRSSEQNLAIGHLIHVKAGDLILFDRGYPSYEYLASIAQRSADYVGRCSRGSFKQAQKMFQDDTINSLVTTIKPPASLSKKKIKELRLPQELTVRFIRVILSTGETEVLVTSILDESLKPDIFKELYYLRWGIETYYHILKSHLALENFSGFTVESVKQDFYAMVFMTSLEAVLVDDAQTVLDCKTNLNKQVVNRAISFNALKNNVIQLFHSDIEIETVLDKLTALFLSTPTIRRNGRDVDRKKSTSGKIINFLRRRKKIIF